MSGLGPAHNVIVLSADHGLAEMPEYLTERGYSVGRFYNGDVLDLANALGKELYAVDNIARTFFRPSLYLDHAVIDASGLAADEVARALAMALAGAVPIGVAAATQDLLTREHSGVARQMQLNSHPERSGDI